MRDDRSTMPTPVLVGLPGAGKTTIAHSLGERLKRPVFASDPFFRECRALPRGSSDPRRTIMDRFLRRWETEQPSRYAALRRDADAVVAGRCPLHDGRYFRSHGEDAFRTYEGEVLKWAQERGLLHAAIPDLSASAPLRPDVQALFAPQNGYLPILLDAAPDVLLRNVLADFARFRDERDAGRAVPIRGEYERDLDAALADARADGRAIEKALEDAARTKLEQAAALRLPTYRDYARATIPVCASDPVTRLCDDVLEALALAGKAENLSE